MLPDPVAIETATDFSRAGVPGKGSCDTQHKWDRQDNSPHPQRCAHGIFLLSLPPSCSSSRPLLATSLCLTSVGVLIPATVNLHNYSVVAYLFALALRPRGGAFPGGWLVSVRSAVLQSGWKQGAPEFTKLSPNTDESHFSSPL